ncbi:hypothetical protein C5167_024975 [Papaver somniferum]|uniref:TNase-like domain-containing protein n=1 Tax=Papaver somniferum TaxID=3469 RepID=A0A4Y7JR59_PAPSO|nr:hypothetical protein C5167_024975 [Papaver somniferum]
MGNALRILCGNCFNPIDHQEYESLGGVSTDTDIVGVSALAHDLFHFDITSQVPERLGGHVASSMETQTTWFVKLLRAWKDANPPPKTPEQRSRLVFRTLEMADDVEFRAAVAAFPPPNSLPKGVLFVLQKLRVDARGVAAGDCLTVFVDVADPREARIVPKVVQLALSERLKARASKDYATGNAYYIIMTKLWVLDTGVLMHQKGKEAKDELTQPVQGKSLTVHVYGVDQLVGDVYCNGLLVQEAMLKKGCAWHRAAYDQRRPELIQWEMEARGARVGLWALRNPKMPWERRIPISNRRIF